MVGPILVALLVLVLAPAARAQEGPFTPLPPGPARDAPPVPVPIAPAGRDDDEGLSGPAKLALLGAGGLLIAGIAGAIVRDARRAAPARRPAPGPVGGTPNRKGRAKAKARAKARRRGRARAR